MLEGSNTAFFDAVIYF